MADPITWPDIAQGIGAICGVVALGWNSTGAIVQYLERKSARLLLQCTRSPRETRGIEVAYGVGVDGYAQGAVATITLVSPEDAVLLPQNAMVNGEGYRQNAPVFQFDRSGAARELRMPLILGGYANGPRLGDGPQLTARFFVDAPGRELMIAKVRISVTTHAGRRVYRGTKELSPVTMH